MPLGDPPATAGPSQSVRTGSAEIPLFPLHAVLFPGGPLPLRIFEPRYVDMVRTCMREGAPFGVILIRDGHEAGQVTSMASFGTSARIVDFSQLPDGLLGIACSGEQKFRLSSHRVQSDGLNIGTMDWVAPDTSLAVPSRHEHLTEILRRVLPQLAEIYGGIPTQFDDAGWVGSRLAEILPISLPDKQTCLELDDPLARLDQLSALVRPA